MIFPIQQSLITIPLPQLILSINTMAAKPSDSPLQKYLIVGSALGAAYLLFNYLANRVGKAKGCNLDTTKKLMREIKYQVYTFCIPFAEAISSKLKIGAPAKDIEIYFRTELAKGYEVKEGLILNKYDVTREEYAAALERYKNDKEISADQQQILKLLEQTIKGQIQFQIPVALKRLFTLKEVIALYRQLCERISIEVSKVLRQAINKNPDFNSKDDLQYKAAMKDMNIYEYKVNYLKNKGFKQEWGCPNFNFLKLLESLKRENLEVKLSATQIDKAYTKVIDLVQKEPSTYGEVEILRLMEDEIAKGEKQFKPPQKKEEEKFVPKQLVQSLPNPVPVRKAPATKPKEEEFDLEELMMKELLSRSQEMPKEEIKVEKIEKVEKVVAEPVEQKVEAVVQVQVQAKAQPVFVPQVELVAEPAVESVEPKVEEIIPVEVEAKEQRVSGPVQVFERIYQHSEERHPEPSEENVQKTAEFQPQESPQPQQPAPVQQKQETVRLVRLNNYPEVSQ